MGAAIAFPFVALLFHDIDTMAGLFIHIFPPMVAYTFRWYPDRVHETWPQIFDLGYLREMSFFINGRPTLGTVAGKSMLVYLMWLVPYSIWMLLIGLHLPRKDRTLPDGNAIVPRFDTVFHIAMRGGGCLAIGKLWGRSTAESIHQMMNNHFERKDLLVYLAIHAAMSIFAIVVLGYLCYSNQTVHGSLLILLAVLAAFRGAKRYTYYTTSMYSRLLRTHFSLLDSR